MTTERAIDSLPNAHSSCAQIDAHWAGGAYFRPCRMAYSLSFSEAFYVDDDFDDITPSERPTSVYQAILSIQEEEWKQIAHDVFGADPEHLDPIAVLDKIRETDTCSNLDSPVEVWIDEEGWHRLEVYE